MKWTRREWNHSDVQILYKANDFLKRKEKQELARTRLICWWVAKMSGKQFKRDPKLHEIFMLPGEKRPLPQKIATMRFMSREEIKQRFGAGNIEIPEWQIDKIMKRQEKARQRPNAK